MIFDGHTKGVEEYEHDDCPVEPLRFNHVPYAEPKSLLCPPESCASTMAFGPGFHVARAAKAC